MTDRPPITLLVHTRNSEEDLVALLDSTAWCDERVVIDMASTDGTVGLATDRGCRVIGIDAEPFADGLRNRHLAEATGEWTLVLDSDESLAADAEEAIRALIASADDGVTAFAIPRFNRIAGQVLTGPVWYPDHQVRLFRSDSIRYLPGHHRRPVPIDPTARVVEVDPDGGVHIHHENYDTIAEFIERQLQYALSDSHDPDPIGFDFDTFLLEGQRRFDDRFAPDDDGPMSYALATVMYWDAVVRGLLEWEAGGRVAPLTGGVLGPRFMRPEHSGGSDSALHRRIADLEEEAASYREQVDALWRSRSMRYTAPLRRIARLVRDRRV